MKKLILTLLFLALPSYAYASSASSTIINNVSSSSVNSDTRVKSHTDITVETDGEVTHYASDEPNKTIHVESNNGKSKIEIDGKEVSGDDNSQDSPTASKSPTPKEENDAQEQIKRGGLIQRLFDQLMRPFKIIFSIIH